VAPPKTADDECGMNNRYVRVDPPENRGCWSFLLNVGRVAGSIAILP